VRLFVGVWPDSRTVETLSGLRHKPGSDLRWIASFDWHVTLSFLGSVPDHEVDPLVEVLAAVGTSSPLVTAHLGPATQLLGRGVLCIPVDGLDQLADTVLDATAPFSRSPDRDRPFFGHLSLARAVGRRAIPRQVAGSAVSADWSVGAFRLVRSTTGPRGSSYNTVAIVHLGTPGPSHHEHVFGYTVLDEHRLPDTPSP
jgi:RNA 2',3'-cyclic 3'-phosphodiesterase